MRGLVDHEALDLVEHRRVRLVAVAAIRPPWHDDADRRLLRQHSADLHRRGMRAQHRPRAVLARGQIERVVHLPRGMFRRDVEHREIVVVALDIRPFGEVEPHIGEDRDQLVGHLRHRMDAPRARLERERHGRQGHIHPLGLQPVLQRGGGEARLLVGNRPGDAVAQRIEGGAGGLALLGRQRAQRLQQFGDDALLAERMDTRGLQRGLVFARGDAREEIAFERGNVSHGGPREESTPLRGVIPADGPSDQCANRAA